jgi:Carbamoyl-phosphate synthase L chain, ATP binding domain
MKRILMIAADNNRWGPVRLPQPLSESGVEVAVLCTANNPLRQSSFSARTYNLDQLKSWRKFGKTLGTVMSDWKPDLVIACDELVVSMLHFFLKRSRTASRFFNHSQLSLLQMSIGKIDMLDTMVLKHRTRMLAESLGIPVPKSQLVRSPSEAQNAATSFGFPVFLKASFSWGGEGSICCKNLDQLHQAFSNLQDKTSWFKSLAKRALARDWYPMNFAIEVQQAIAGDAVMYNVVALEGKVLGGFFAERPSRSSTNGPSTVVCLGENPTCLKIAEKMIAAMGASGFLAFDYMRSETTGEIFLLECNPRPNQIFHLGPKVGADLCRALVDGLYGRSPSSCGPQGTATVPLFPQLWLHDENAALAEIQTLDVPENDSNLLDFMLRIGRDKGHAINRLLDVLKIEGRVPVNYTFG